MVIVLKLSPSSAREKCKALGIATPVMNHQQEPELMEALKRAEVVGNNAKEVCTIQLQHVLKLAKAVLGATDEATLNLQHMVGNSKGPEAQRYGLTSTSSRTRKGKGKEDNPVLPQYQDPIVHQSIWESATVRTPGPTTYHHQVPTPPPLFSLRPSQPRNPLSSVIPGGHSTPTSRGHPPPPPAIRLPGLSPIGVSGRCYTRSGYTRVLYRPSVLSPRSKFNMSRVGTCRVVACVHALDLPHEHHPILLRLKGPPLRYMWHSMEGPTHKPVDSD